jgi:hypothetical protein
MRPHVVPSLVFAGALLIAVLAGPANAAPGGNGNGNGNAYGHGYGNGGGNGKGNGGGGSGAPLPLLGASIAGQIVAVGGAYLLWRRRRNQG